MPRRGCGGASTMSCRSWERGRCGAISGTRTPRKRFELADRLARVFDRCLLYRPDWIREWERGVAPHWQARLWQRLAGDRRWLGEGRLAEAERPAGEERPAGGERPVGEERPIGEGRLVGGERLTGEGRSAGGERLAREERSGKEKRRATERRAAGEERSASADHWVAAIDAFHARLAAGARPSGWPRRAAFFGVSSLSPSYLEMLRRAAEGIEIHLFMLVPCREYWGDIRSKREIHRPGRG